MAKQTFSVGQVLTAAQMTSLQQTAMGGGSATAKTTSYVLVAADAGTVVSVNSTSATTITVNTGLFAAGDTVFIQNWGSGSVTITAGTATVNTHGSLVLAQYEGGTLYFTSASAAIFFDISQTSGMTNPMTTTGDTIYSSSGSTPARLGIGSTGQVLTVAGGIPSWATPASGASITLLSTTTLSGTSTTISSISGSYTNLYLLIQDVYTASGTLFQFYINTDASMNYNTWGLADTTVDNRSGQGAGYARIGFLGNTSSGSSNTFSGAININNYASSTLNKSWNAFTSGKDSSNRRTGTVVSGSYYGGAITSVKFDLDGFSFSGGSVRIYGVN